jgi:hypothetical protein
MRQKNSLAGGRARRGLGDDISQGGSRSRLGAEAPHWLWQFLAGTWQDEAERSKTYLHSVAGEKGHLDAKGKVLAAKREDLLELRYEPTCSIVAAAEYDQSVFDKLFEHTTRETSEVDRVFFSKHPERDFSKKPLGGRDDAELVQEWTQLFNAQPGKPLISRGLSNDQKARYLYLCHHEGDQGAIQVLTGSLKDGRAAGLLKANVPDTSRREALIKEHGGVSKAYIQWLWSYIDQHIQPSGFRS